MFHTIHFHNSYRKLPMPKNRSMNIFERILSTYTNEGKSKIGKYARIEIIRLSIKNVKPAVWQYLYIYILLLIFSEKEILLYVNCVSYDLRYAIEFCISSEARYRCFFQLLRSIIKQLPFRDIISQEYSADARLNIVTVTNSNCKISFQDNRSFPRNSLLIVTRYKMDDLRTFSQRYIVHMLTLYSPLLSVDIPQTHLDYFKYRFY